MSTEILHIPHSSTHIPFFDGFAIGEEELQNEINLLTDWFTDELYDLPYKKIISPFSRLFCDVERFANDSDEEMAQYGMGMCHTHFDNGEVMRDVSPELRSSIKSDYYDHHHQSLEKACSEALKEHKRVLIIDCHSFPDKPLKRDLSQHTPRPDFCIGSDVFHSPREVVASSITFLNSKGYIMSENEPFSGTIIPMKYYHKDKNVLGIMIEVNRKLYMSEADGKVNKTSKFNGIRKVLSDLILFLSSLET
jgi:N-formylglutamate deformylase